MVCVFTYILSFGIGPGELNCTTASLTELVWENPLEVTVAELQQMDKKNCSFLLLLFIFKHLTFKKSEININKN